MRDRGQEFLDHRQFHQGDDLRAVNWRAYMRLEKLFLKMFQVEPRMPMRFLLDMSESMGVGQAGEVRLCAQLAAALCYVGLVRLDTIACSSFRAGIRKPISRGGRAAPVQAAV